jgi:alpha-mannosidase
MTHWFALCLLLSAPASAQLVRSEPDLAKQPTLYVVAYAHLDTQYNWDYTKTIRQYLPDTIHKNFALFEKYPNYIFNFSGANRYRMMKEYYPADYAKIKEYVAAGRWFPAGSSMEEGDVNSPSAESVIRQILYGKEYFRRDFGKTSMEFMLPDCFGFPASLPSILAHVGLKGFSTQKLGWGSSALTGGPNSAEQTPLGVPFNVGLWVGPDGKSVVAALNPGTYASGIFTDLTSPPPDATAAGQDFRRRELDWVRRVQRNGQATGLFADYRYYGTGDMGGAPNENSVRMMEAIVTKSPNPLAGGAGAPVGNGPLRVVSATSDQMFLDIRPELAAKLPRYQGELELTNHSAGSLTSQAYMKRWNRQNEVLADAAERASVAAEWLGVRDYPMSRLTDAWTLALGGQFHDIIPGTSIPRAYELSWNDEILALNQFAGVLTSATEGIVSQMDTQAKGMPIVVFNSLNVEREDVVEANVPFPDGQPAAVRVVGPVGTEVPAQISGGKVLFIAKAPPVGYAVYDVQPASSPVTTSALEISESSIENARYRLSLDERGDVASIFDKKLQADLLLTPIRMEIKTDFPSVWPAWNMDWPDQVRAPRAIVGAGTGSTGGEKPVVRILERGPARIALEILRRQEGSTFVQTVRLAAGDGGNRVEFANAIDWNTRASHLKTVFPLRAANPTATYNLDIGTIERGTNSPTKFEVASHQWIDLADQGGQFGATLLTDCKYGSDKPDDNTLRLTLIRTPGTRLRIPGVDNTHAEQDTQDLGHHEFVYGISGHAGSRQDSQTDWQAYRLNYPMAVFAASKHAGTLGKSFSMLRVSNSRIRVLALKKAENAKEVVIRLVELDGKTVPSVKIGFAGAITSAREINGAEESVGPATVQAGMLVASFAPFQPRTFAVTLLPPAHKAEIIASMPLPLPYDIAGSTTDGSASLGGGFDGLGNAMPAEMLPAALSFNGVQFKLEAGDGTKNTLVSRGQRIDLPGGAFNSVYVLAAADGDQQAQFRVGGQITEVTIQNWTGFIGQWDTRLWESAEELVPARQGQRPETSVTRVNPFAKMVGIRPGYVKRSPLAWNCSHQHTSEGKNEPYAYSYIFAYRLDAPANARTLVLPDKSKIRILAISVAQEHGVVTPAAPLYDTLERGDRVRP